MNADFRYPRRVHFAETDMAGIVHFSVYFRYMEEAEHALWRAAGLSIVSGDGGAAWPRVAAAFDYKHPLRVDEELVVAVRIAAVSRRTIQYRFTLTTHDAVIGSGFLTVACAVRSADGRLQSTALPRGLVERLEGAMGAREPEAGSWATFDQSGEER